jgi:hypothetical protein
MANDTNGSAPLGPGWQPHPSAPITRRAGVTWLISAVAMVPLAMLLLFTALMVDSVALVYASILATFLAVPFAIIGIIRLSTSR